MVADFYEVPRDRLGELLVRRRWKETIAGLRRPVPRYESPHYYLVAVLGVLGDAPLPSGEQMLGEDGPAHPDLLTELVERRGGGWTIIEPSPERVAALDPAAFDSERLRAHYAGALHYFPDPAEAGEGDEPGLLERLLDRLTSDDLARYPADAGEQMLRDIALLRTGLTAISPNSVLVIHTH